MLNEDHAVFDTIIFSLYAFGHNHEDLVEHQPWYYEFLIIIFKY